LIIIKINKNKKIEIKKFEWIEKLNKEMENVSVKKDIGVFVLNHQGFSILIHFKITKKFNLKFLKIINLPLKKGK
jgi:hypothetical protein